MSASKKESFSHLPRYEIDKLYQDEMFEVLQSMPVGSSILAEYLDIKYIAKSLQRGLEQDTNTFLNLQSELLYGEPTSLDHLRPNPIETKTLISFLSAHGIEGVVMGDEISEKTIVIAKKREQLELPDINTTKFGLPPAAADLYLGNVAMLGCIQQMQSRELFPQPRVLNIGSGAQIESQIPHAINVDTSPIGNPDVVADARKLPFKDNFFTVVMASHVLEHIPPQEIESTISEWIRILHPKGMLRIAVPDAETTLRELIIGTTSKGAPSYGIPGGSPPLTQLMGLGAENSATSARWRHQVLFSRQMIAEILSDLGLSEVSEYSREQSLTHISGIKADETNRYSLRIGAMATRKPHETSKKIDEEEYKNIKLKYKGLDLPPLSIVVPIKNEEINLHTFLDVYSQQLDELVDLGISHETIFVINGCTDNSSLIVKEFIERNANKFNLSLTESENGIYQAFVRGIKSRDLNGQIAKIDVDTDFNYWTLPLLIFDLKSNQERRVVYAEVAPKESRPNRFNMSEYYQEFRTQRLYYHGRLSLYRDNPFDIFPEEIVSQTNALVEDMVLSCLYSYYFGLDSIGPTRGAIVRSKQPTSFDMSIRKFDRTRSEIQRIEEVLPHMNILSSILKRVSTNPPKNDSGDHDLKTKMWHAYHQLHQAMTNISRLNDGVTSDVTEWERLR